MMNGLNLIRTINCIWRLYNMQQQAMGFMKGIGAGLVAGMTMAAIGNRMMNENSRSFRHRANRTLRNVNELIGNMQGMFR